MDDQSLRHAHQQPLLSTDEDSSEDEASTTLSVRSSDEVALKHLPRHKLDRDLPCAPSRSFTGTKKRRSFIVAAATCALILLIILLGTLLPPHHKGHPKKNKNHKGPHRSPWSKENVTHCTTWPNNLDIPANFSFTSSVEHGPSTSTYQMPPVNTAESYVPPTKPTGYRIVGVVFYGRRETVDILDCYLKRNLVTNGCWLDEVYFMPNTNDEDDQKYLVDLLPTHSLYTQKDLPLNHTTVDGKINWGSLWEVLTEPDTIYVKIDDDVVWVHDNAIPSMVETLLDYGDDAFAINANTINSMMVRTHAHSGAIHPYLPEADNSTIGNRPYPEWRPSTVPVYSGNFTEHPPHIAVPYIGHRWSRVTNASDIWRTSVGSVLAGDVKPLWSWGSAVQQHYSLLENIEKGELYRYVLNTRVSNRQFQRFNINFMAIKSKDIIANIPIGKDDEKSMTVGLPRKTSRPFLVDSHALVAHLHFFRQKRAVRKTDLIDRWRAYANEFICEPDNLKRPLVPQCPGF